MHFFKHFLKYPYSSYASIMCAMIRKDIFLLKNKTVDVLVNSAIVLSIELITWCYLYPLIGMPKDLILPMFVGWPLLNIMINLGYCFSMKYTLGALYTGYGFMEYDLTLPLPTSYILTHYIVSFLIEACVSTLPLIIGGLSVLSYMGSAYTGSLFLFCIIYVATLIILGITFLALSFWYPNQWFENNLWPRRIGPLITFAAIFAPWTKIYAFSKPIGIIMLLNPLTYVTEAMRAALLGNDGFIPLWICIVIMIKTFIFTAWWMQKSVRKKLDLI